MDIIKTFAPANANLSEKDVAAMRELTDEQISELAKTYPNRPTGNSYLVLYDKNQRPEEQRYPLSTWANLHNLRRLGQKGLQPYHFRMQFFKRQEKATEPAKQRTVDLSEEETKQAVGIKKQEEPAPTKQESSSDELEAARAELQKAIDEKAHHMIVKKLKKQVDELENQNKE